MSELSLYSEAATKIFEAAQPQSDGFDVITWRAFEDAGFHRLLMSEDHGGAGDVFSDAASICRAAGHSGVAIPVVETLVANWCLSRATLDLAEGPAALVFSDVSLFPDAATAPLPWAPIAGRLIHLQRSGAGTAELFVQSASALQKTGTTMAGEPAARLPAGTADHSSRIDFFDTAYSLAAILKAAAMVGAMERVLEMSVDYANTRKQFGRAIGTFQAVQQMVVAIASETAAVDMAVAFGIDRLSSNPLWGAAAAKGRASDAALPVAALAHQIHGAIGYTAEFDLHRHTKHLWAWRDQFGDEVHWYREAGRAAQNSGETLWHDLSGAGLSLNAGR